jgi:CDP-glycerol glycerophosphotransferase (TagB/SpsB family)
VDGWIKVPVGPHAAPWRTVSPVRTVLAVVHNVTSATRLLDVLPLVAADRRVQVVFTCTGSSPFTPGTEEFLTARGMSVLPWAQAIRTEFDVAVSASYGGDLHDLLAPVVCVPHGMGYNKYLPGNRKSEIGNRKSVFGLDGESLFRGGQLIPATIVLSHDEQRDRLRAAFPAAADIAVVAGDPCFDRMLATLPLRAAHRAAFGAAPGQRLVVVSSTWGAESLFGRRSGLVAELAERLPCDDYRIVLALHPNVWHGHSPWQVRRWVADCARAGVVVLPPEDGWRSALVAADVVVGDHGSVTFYAAALGRPVLLASAPDDAVDPLSPVGRLIADAPAMTPTADPVALLEHTITTHDPARYADVTAFTTSVPGRSAALLRTLLYHLLDLPEPPGDAETPALPLPTVEAGPIGAVLVDVRIAPTDTGGLTATVTRRTAEPLGRPGTPPQDGHLVVDTDEPRQRLLVLAEILVHRRSSATDTLDRLLAELPGCLLATSPERPGAWLVTDRTGTRVRFTGIATHTGHSDGPVCASIVHAWLSGGRALASLPTRIEVTLGPKRHRLVAEHITE